MNNRLIIFLLFAVVAAAVYGNTLHSPFVFDDLENIRSNRALRIDDLGPGSLVKAGFSGPSYRRPVANVSFALNYYLGGYQVFGYHLVNIIIHWLCGVFLYLLLDLTLAIWAPERPAQRWIAFCAALIWLVHPIQTQAVTYIVQRMTSLSALFYVMCLWAYARGRSLHLGLAGNQETGNRAPAIYYIASLIAGLLAMGTKEVAAPLPVFVYLYEWYFIQNLNKDWFRRNAAYLITALVALGLAGLVYLGFDPMEKILSGYGRRDFTLGQRLLTEPRVVLFYLSLILVPHPARLNLDHHFPVSQSLTDPASTLFSLLLLTGLVAAALVTARRQRLLSFGILWFLGNLVIESSVIGLEIAFEHRNYLPSMFLILAGVTAGFQVMKKPRAAVTVFTVVAVIFSLGTIQRNRIWQNEVVLWQDCVMKSPDKARPHYNLGLVLAENGQSPKAIEHYRRALQIEPDTATFHTNLAIELAALGDIDGAMRHYEKALAIAPGFFYAHLNMGKALVQSGDREAARAHFEKASTIKPDSGELHKTLGLLALDDRQLNKAARHFAMAIKANPDDDDAYNSLGATLMRGNRLNEAAKLFLTAVKLNPSNTLASANLKTAIRAMIDRNRRQFELAADN